jgi:hypothetical protein
MKLRSIVLALALLASVAAAVFGVPTPDTGSAELVAPSEPRERRGRLAGDASDAAPGVPVSAGAGAAATRALPNTVDRAPEEPTTAPASRGEKRFGPAAANLFASRSWQPPPPPVVAARQAAPTAPPLPFKYLGKLMDHGVVTAFVSQGALTHLLHKGDVLAEYRVEKITPVDVTFVYLPLNERQRLPIGSEN